MFKGSYVALITPFHPDGSINFEKIKELCNWHIANGTDGLVVIGTTGEASTTEHAEDAAIVRCVVDCVNGRIPIIAGYARNVVLARVAARDIEKYGSVIEYEDRGYRMVKTNPAVDIMNKAQNAYEATAIKLGLTPTGRKRLKGEEKVKSPSEAWDEKED